jgi:aryl-alcohol dehydrogenase-like predicted oxidoreductase
MPISPNCVRGLTVPRPGFGGASLGDLYRVSDDDEAAAAVDAAWDGGARYFDTAPHYGLGLSERGLGAALPLRRPAWFRSCAGCARQPKSGLHLTTAPRRSTPRRGRTSMPAHGGA